jgi:hypothetical protein
MNSTAALGILGMDLSLPQTLGGSSSAMVDSFNRPDPNAWLEAESFGREFGPTLDPDELAFDFNVEDYLLDGGEEHTSMAADGT